MADDEATEDGLDFGDARLFGEEGEIGDEEGCGGCEEDLRRVSVKFGWYELWVGCT